VRSAWTREALVEQGFVGWVPLRLLDSVQSAPVASGVYVVLFAGAEPFDWQASCGGWFKGCDPSISSERLDANWVAGANVVYIGKGNSLRRRLVEFAKFGQGRAIGHWGGRILWHLPNPDGLLVAWRPTPETVDPAKVESELIDGFRLAYGKPPFANRPERSGA
jgi:hypothetical protein